MTRRRSVTQMAIDNMIFRVTTRNKRKPELPPSQIPTYAYTAHL
ncbi:NinE family protein, partial [Cronobacter sakazakii]